MVRIRKANYFDKYKLKKMISFLSNDVINHYTKVLTNEPFSLLHETLPLKFKFLPETYVIEENKNIIGMVTLTPTPGNPYKLVINRLFLEQDYFNAGKQLIDYVVSKYGAKGATAIVATIDDSYDELLGLFADGCGFRQCSSEQLWKIDNFRFSRTENTFFRPFKNSDSQSVASMFNDTVITHFKYSVSRTKNEYSEPFFKGLNDNYKLRYIVEDENSKKIKTYFSLTTDDNSNYILDIAASSWYDCCWDDILNFTVNQISKRQKDFYLFIRVRKYTTTAESLENYLKEKEAKCVQNQMILVKDFYKILKEPQSAHKIILFNGINEKPVFKI